jgi:glutaredoxin 2
MALGFLDIPWKSIPVPYNEEDLLIKLTGKKMLPIMEFEDGAMNESLDIIKRLDKENVLGIGPSEVKGQFEKIDILLDKIGKDVHSLCMPYWIWTKEFNPKSRHYFQSKKEKKRGPFGDLIKNKETFLKNLEVTLKEVEENLDPYFSVKFSIFDIMLASHLWGMYIFPEFQFSEKLHNYLQDVREKCNFQYHEDFWGLKK